MHALHKTVDERAKAIDPRSVFIALLNQYYDQMRQVRFSLYGGGQRNYFGRYVLRLQNALKNGENDDVLLIIEVFLKLNPCNKPLHPFHALLRHYFYYYGYAYPFKAWQYPTIQQQIIVSLDEIRESQHQAAIRTLETILDGRYLGGDTLARVVKGIKFKPAELDLFIKELIRRLDDDTIKDKNGIIIALSSITHLSLSTSNWVIQALLKKMAIFFDDICEGLQRFSIPDQFIYPIIKRIMPHLKEAHGRRTRAVFDLLKNLPIPVEFQDEIIDQLLKRIFPFGNNEYILKSLLSWKISLTKLAAVITSFPYDKHHEYSVEIHHFWKRHTKTDLEVAEIIKAISENIAHNYGEDYLKFVEMLQIDEKYHASYTAAVLKALEEYKKTAPYIDPDCEGYFIIHCSLFCNENNPYHSTIMQKILEGMSSPRWLIREKSYKAAGKIACNSHNKFNLISILLNNVSQEREMAKVNLARVLHEEIEIPVEIHEKLFALLMPSFKNQSGDVLLIYLKLFKKLILPDYKQRIFIQACLDMIDESPKDSENIHEQLSVVDISPSVREVVNTKMLNSLEDESWSIKNSAISILTKLINDRITPVLLDYRPSMSGPQRLSILNAYKKIGQLKELMPDATREILNLLAQRNLSALEHLEEVGLPTNMQSDYIAILSDLIKRHDWISLNTFFSKLHIFNIPEGKINVLIVNVFTELSKNSVKDSSYEAFSALFHIKMSLFQYRKVVDLCIAYVGGMNFRFIKPNAIQALLQLRDIMPIDLVTATSIKLDTLSEERRDDLNALLLSRHYQNSQYVLPKALLSVRMALHSRNVFVPKIEEYIRSPAPALR